MKEIEAMQSLNTCETDVYLADDLRSDLAEMIKPYKDEKVFVLTDGTTRRLCFPLIEDVPGIDRNRVIEIAPGDDAKDTDALIYVWAALVEGGATRHSLLVNLGGGMPCDLGGFAAATFKRGIDFINIPTTLLAQVDASVGGKTGINFKGYKNEIGSFKQAKYVLVDTSLLRSLDGPNLKSGFAEMIKHALLVKGDLLNRTIAFDILNPDMAILAGLVAESIRIKDDIVSDDPYEKGIRKALNLGHTAGHAIESLALKRGKPVLHGYAVAYGIVVELYLAWKKLGFSEELLRLLSEYIYKIFGRFEISKGDYTYLYDAMTHDKKNSSGRINFTLLREPGDIAIDTHCEREEVIEALEFYRQSYI